MNKRLTTACKIYNILLILGILLMAGTVVRVSAYTVFVSDDFWHCNRTGVLNVDFLTRVKAAWNYTVYMYKDHQGCYSIFFLALFNPIGFYGFDGLRIIMVANSIMFFASMIILIVTVFNAAVKRYDATVRRSILMTILFCAVFVMTQYDAFAETFNWYTGATNYSMPLAFMNFAIAAMIGVNNYSKHPKRLAIIAILCSIFASGGYCLSADAYAI